MLDDQALDADRYIAYYEDLYGDYLEQIKGIYLDKDEVTETTTDDDIENTFAAIRKCSNKFKKEIFLSEIGLRNFTETQCNITEIELYRALNHTLKGFLLTS